MKGSLRKETTGSPLTAPLPFGVKPSPTVICHLSRTRINREGTERPGKAIHGEIRGREERGRAEGRRVDGGWGLAGAVLAWPPCPYLQIPQIPRDEQ